MLVFVDFICTVLSQIAPPHGAYSKVGPYLSESSSMAGFIRRGANRFFTVDKAV